MHLKDVLPKPQAGLHRNRASWDEGNSWPLGQSGGFVGVGVGVGVQ